MFIGLAARSLFSLSFLYYFFSEYKKLKLLDSIMNLLLKGVAVLKWDYFLKLFFKKYKMELFRCSPTICQPGIYFKNIAEQKLRHYDPGKRDKGWKWCFWTKMAYQETKNS